GTWRNAEPSDPPAWRFRATLTGAAKSAARAIVDAPSSLPIWSIEPRIAAPGRWVRHISGHPLPSNHYRRTHIFLRRLGGMATRRPHRHVKLTPATDSP